MRDIDLGDLLFPLIILFFLLVNYLVQYFKRESPRPDGLEPVPENEPRGRRPEDSGHSEVPVAAAPGSTPEAVVFRAPRRVTAATLVPTGASSLARTLLANRSRVREGIVLMTVLGACRAMESRQMAPENRGPV